jgi:hypothetical protein
LLKEEELERTEEYVIPLSNTNWFEAVISSPIEDTQTPKNQRLFSHNHKNGFYIVVLLITYIP